MQENQGKVKRPFQGSLTYTKVNIAVNYVYVYWQDMQRRFYIKTQFFFLLLLLKIERAASEKHPSNRLLKFSNGAKLFHVPDGFCKVSNFQIWQMPQSWDESWVLARNQKGRTATREPGRRKEFKATADGSHRNKGGRINYSKNIPPMKGSSHQMVGTTMPSLIQPQL